ncbi:hypothetical protein [Halobacterium hubeiense]|uniref:hypothetical protein n=1 Tax=Halobacterium hubeiense TaxID=1407499 RepID=UPI003C794DB7
MVSITLSLLALLFGFLAYAGLPVLVARYYSESTMISIGEFYFWLSMHSYRRLAIVRRRLSGYMLKPFSLDDEKQAAKLSLNDDAHVQDPADTVKRLQNKPLLLFPEQTPTAVDATVSELGEFWGKHKQHDNHVQKTATDGGTGAEPKVSVNPYFRVPSGIRLVDPSQALHIIASDADPSDPTTAEDLTEKSLEKFRDRIGAMETMATIMGFLASAGFIVGVDKYILDSSGGGGGGGMPAPPIPMGTLSIDPTVLFSLVQVLPL